MNKFLFVPILATLVASTQAAILVTESFGSGANAFTMDFVTIGNPNNAADTTGNPNPVGSVAYTYSLGKFEVSRDMITKANTAGSLGITMSDLTGYGGNGVNKPATGVTWFDAAKYVNWLNTSTGGQQRISLLVEHSSCGRQGMLGTTRIICIGTAWRSMSLQVVTSGTRERMVALTELGIIIPLEVTPHHRQ